MELVDAKTDIRIFVQGNHGENLEIPKRNFVKPEEALEVSRIYWATISEAVSQN